MQRQAHVAPWKKSEVGDSVKFLKSQQVVGIVDIGRLPAKQLQSIRSRLRDKVGIRAAKNSLLKLAIQEASKDRKGFDKLKDFVDGQRAVVVTSMNPFRLFKELEATKTKAPAKGGETAESDITVSEGETNFKPGPIIGELQKAGLPAVIEKGKIIIKKDILIVKKGERISRDVANALTKLEIYPLTVGLSLVGAYENGLVYGRDSLAVDEEMLMGQMGRASSEALALAMGIHYPTARTTPLLVTKAYRDAMSVGIEAKIVNKHTIRFILQLAAAQAQTVRSKVENKGG